MVKRMLIDATHPEETRVAVVDGNRLDEFDFESAAKKQLKGNIYLAKVTRVEPSLQAAFVEYGGNRHGFLAFSEIHPDYYRIPVGDQKQLIEEQMALEKAAAEAEDAELEDDLLEGDDDAGEDESADEESGDDDAGEDDTVTSEDDDADGDGADDEDALAASAEDTAETVDMATDEDADTPRARDGDTQAAAEDIGSEASDDAATEDDDPADGPERLADSTGAPVPAEIAQEPDGADADQPDADEAEETPRRGRRRRGGQARGRGGNGGARRGRGRRARGGRRGGDDVETVGGDEIDDADGRQRRSVAAHRRYKIQEVIKRRQILLVQVNKEERGNKGAALTTYLSLAGRYCVLMPNTPRGGGISRKIASPNDRKRLKEILDDLDIPEGMAVIVRTAGSERSKAEIKRDYEYLLRLWEEIRKTTLESIAPTLVHEEGNLIKRSIRDLYTKDISEILVEGDEGYKTAKSFMKMLIPSHAKRVKPYKEEELPLFHRYQVETQLDAIHNPTVQLKSGGYVVINQTEALVAIDVNSGRSTRERNIEETALKTNLEAAEEVARQLRLRDLAGLVVIDFIDMDENRHNVQVERRLKESMQADRARIQLGRISAFGLLELSRQRLRPSLAEAVMLTCPHCQGTGLIRSVESTALHVLRTIEEEGMRRRSAAITMHVPTQVALYVLNQKREALAAIETRHGFTVRVFGDDGLVPPDYRMEREALAKDAPRPERRIEAPVDVEDTDEDEEEEEDDAPQTSGGRAASDEDGDDQGGRKRRRRGRRGGRRRGRKEDGEADDQTADAGAADEARADADVETAEPVSGSIEVADTESVDTVDTDDAKPKRRRARRGRGKARDDAKTEDATTEESPSEEIATEGDATVDDAAAEPTPVAEVTEPVANDPVAAPEPLAAEAVEQPTGFRSGEPEAITDPPETSEDDKPRRRGWWNRFVD